MELVCYDTISLKLRKTDYFTQVSAIYRFVTHKFSGQEKTPETLHF